MSSRKYKINPGHEDIPLDEMAGKFLHRLSSGETKPASLWISVEERVPEPGQSIYIFVDGNIYPGWYDYDTGDVLKFWDANDNPIDFVSQWAPRFIPTPPESLT